jgi:DNA-directed RNA polymerase specialized sigma24 family protein
MIATRRTIDHLRKFNFLTEQLEESLENHSADTQERLLDNEELRLLDEAVQDLPAHERIVLDLFFREGFPPKTSRRCSECPSRRSTPRKAASSPGSKKC